MSQHYQSRHKRVHHHHDSHNAFQQNHQKYPVHHPNQHHGSHHSMRHMQLHPKNDVIPVVHPVSHENTTKNHPVNISAQVVDPAHQGSTFANPTHTHNPQGWHTFVPEYTAYTSSYLQNPDSKVIFGLNTPASMMYPNGVPTNHF